MMARRDRWPGWVAHWLLMVAAEIFIALARASQRGLAWLSRDPDRAGR